MIPLQIFQTHKSQKYVDDYPMLKKAQNSWKAQNEFTYTFYNDKECEEFMRENFDDDVYESYMKCPLAVMKSDLWRYCIVYINGGIYADMDSVALTSPLTWVDKNDTAKLIVVPENTGAYFCQWVFAAPKKSPVLKDIIDLIVTRIKKHGTDFKSFENEHYVHHYTGPSVFSDGIVAYLTKHNLPTYSSNKIDYVDYPHKNELKVPENKRFHSKIVNHLFAGGAKDGWTKLRMEYVLKK